jgi:hypothetical protein
MVRAGAAGRATDASGGAVRSLRVAESTTGREPRPKGGNHAGVAAPCPHYDTEPLLVGHLARSQPADGLGPGARHGRRGLRAWLQQHHVARRVAPSRDLAAAPTVSLPHREYFLHRGPIDVVPRFEHLPGHLQTPNMWCPEDRAWFVATEIDFDSTLVACTRACGAALLGSDLEVMEVSAETRLDIDGDTVNVKNDMGSAVRFSGVPNIAPNGISTARRLE